MVKRNTRPVMVGNIQIGGGSPVIVQSMTNTDTRDVKSTVEQITDLTQAGCEVVRLAVPDREAAEVLSDIKAKVSIPLIADIHFDYRLALLALSGG
ncbi:hypothetical protein N752_02570 [Desulforamulus aquiferis]|nr:hypothetical protein N752_02570 [Desulforamulus aquiferis]